MRRTHWQIEVDVPVIIMIASQYADIVYLGVGMHNGYGSARQKSLDKS